MQKRSFGGNHPIDFDPNAFVANLSMDLFGEEISDLLSFQEYTKRLMSAADMQSTPITTTIRLRQAESVFKKNADWPGSSQKDRQLAALSTFAHGERMCKITNKRLSFYSRHWSRRPSIWKYIERAREDISSLLGPLTPRVLHTLFEGSGFGNGATFHAKSSREKSLPGKLLIGTVTPDCEPYFKLALRRTFPNWDCVSWTLVEGNRLASVPKTADTDRPIAVEPSLNVFLQKGVDRFIKRRLVRWGIFLQRQDLNQEAAKIASIKGYNATIDLSSASDSLSVELCRLLLPYDWFIYLDDIRSKKYFHNGEWHSYAKMSSMGNATTFPVETLIFAALARSVLGVQESKHLRVYGDDIIMPSKYSLLMFEVLRFCGFSPNEQKSFLFGPFRESCGVDFLSGVDVRPVYIKNWPSNHPELFNLHNRLLSHRAGLPMPRALSYLRSCARLQFYGPKDLGCSLSSDWYLGKSIVYDGWFFSDNPSKLRKLRSNAYGYRVRKIVTKYPRLSGFDERALYLAFLIGVDKDSIYDTRKPRERIMTLELPSWNY